MKNKKKEILDFIKKLTTSENTGTSIYNCSFVANVHYIMPKYGCMEGYNHATMQTCNHATMQPCHHAIMLMMVENQQVTFK